MAFAYSEVTYSETRKDVYFLLLVNELLSPPCIASKMRHSFSEAEGILSVTAVGVKSHTSFTCALRSFYTEDLLYFISVLLHMRILCLLFLFLKGAPFF